MKNHILSLWIPHFIYYSVSVSVTILGADAGSDKDLLLILLLILFLILLLIILITCQHLPQTLFFHSLLSLLVMLAE